MTFPTSTDVNRPRVLVFLVPGSSLATRMVTVWHRGKARVSHLLGKAPSEVQTTHASTRPFPFPYEIVAMIIAHTRDLRTLKACSLACRSWYSAAAPLLHHTLTLTGDMPGTSHVQMGVLSELHELGLVPLVRQIRIVGAWFGPRTLSDLHLRYFSTFANVHTLSLQELDIYLFMPDIRRYFEHFSSTLRSITLSNPHCTPRQLSHFLSIFTNLENIKIPNGCASIPAVTISDTELIPFSPPKLRGWLLLGNFSWVETWTHLITLCGGLRFRYADLHWSGSCTHTLLEACAETLETVRFDTTDKVRPLSFLNLSGLKALRSLHVEEWLVDLQLEGNRSTLVRDVLSTITSPVFSELVIVLEGSLIFRIPLAIVWCERLRELHGVRPFRLVFSFEGPYLDPREPQSVLERGLRLVTARGLLDFLDSPPTFRIARTRQLGWEIPDLD